MTIPIPPEEDGKWRFDPPSSLWDHLEIAMIKDFPLFHSTPNSRLPGNFLHLGHGNKLIVSDHWRHLDLPDWNAETDQIPMPTGSVDGIVAYHMLDHLSDPRPLLRECERVLDSGGWLVIVVPHFSSELWHSDVDHKSQYGIDTWKNIFADTHYANQGEWEFELGFNILFGFTERNLCVVTQLIRKPWRHAHN